VQGHEPPYRTHPATPVPTYPAACNAPLVPWTHGTRRRCRKDGPHLPLPASRYLRLHTCRAPCKATAPLLPRPATTCAPTPAASMPLLANAVARGWAQSGCPRHHLVGTPVFPVHPCLPHLALAPSYLAHADTAFLPDGRHTSVYAWCRLALADMGDGTIPHLRFLLDLRLAAGGGFSSNFGRAA